MFSSQSEPVWLQALGFVKTGRDTTCKIWVWVLAGVRCVRQQVRGRDVVLKLSADWNVSDCIRILLRMGVVTPRGIIHYTDDATIAATAMIGKRQHTVPRNRTATVRATHAACFDVPGHALLLLH